MGKYLLQKLAQVGLMGAQMTVGKTVTGVVHEKVKQVGKLAGLDLNGPVMNSLGKVAVPTALVALADVFGSKHWTIQIAGQVAEMALMTSLLEASSDLATHVVNQFKDSSTEKV